MKCIVFYITFLNVEFYFSSIFPPWEDFSKECIQTFLSIE